MMSTKFILPVLISAFIACPAVAQQNDEAGAKIMVRCAVMMDEAAILAEQDNAPQEAEKNRVTASAFKLGAAYYMPGQPQVAGAVIQDLMTQYRTELETVDEVTLNGQMAACNDVHDKVQTALDELGKQADEGENAKAQN